MGDIISNKDFKTANDWLNEFMAQFKKTKTVKVGDTEREVEDGVDVETLVKVAHANGFEPKVHGKANPGLFRMTIGNALRARARKRHGLYDAQGNWHEASEVFTRGHEKTENPDGSVIAKPTENTADSPAKPMESAAEG